MGLAWTESGGMVWRGSNLSGLHQAVCTFMNDKMVETEYLIQRTVSIISLFTYPVHLLKRKSFRKPHYLFTFKANSSFSSELPLHGLMGLHQQNVPLFNTELNLNIKWRLSYKQKMCIRLFCFAFSFSIKIIMLHSVVCVRLIYTWNAS